MEEVGIPVEYYQYYGTEQEYIVYNEEAEEPTNHGDNKPKNRVVWWQVHLFAPKESGFRTITRTVHVVISCNMGETEE